MLKGRSRNLYVLLFVLGLVIVSVTIVAKRPTKLGLDLNGGTRLVYQAEPTPQNPSIDADDLDRAIEIIRERVDQFGVSEPEIARVGADQIQVDLPDVADADRAADQVGDTAQMYFYDWEPNVVAAKGVTPEAAPEQAIPKLLDAVRLAAKQKPSCDGCTTGSRFYLFDRETDKPIAGPDDTRAALLSANPAASALPKARRVLIEVPRGTLVLEGAEGQDYAGGGPPVYFVIQDHPALSGDDIDNPEQGFSSPSNQAIVSFDFRGDAGDTFEEVTKAIALRGASQLAPGVVGADVADHFAIVLDDKIISRPIIDPDEHPNGISGGGASIEGSFSIEEAQDLARLLKIGALPVKLNLINQSKVSATLGQQALDQGLKAGLAGIIIVMAFLLLYYRFLGFVAALGLIVYGLFYYALIELIPITMTLPGIAGLILTIGVAADSNIVIFERIKEESRKGRSMLASITTGYGKGIATIVDANVVTLLTAFILFNLTDAGVKGFAFALGVGTVVSLLTAVVFTQAVLGSLGRARFMSSPSFLGAGEQKVNWDFDFAGMSRWFFSFSGAILLIGAISFSTQQLNFGIDFESGTRITVSLGKDASISQVRGALSNAQVPDSEGIKIQTVDNPDFGLHVYQIQSQALDNGAIARVSSQLKRDFGIEHGDEGFDFTTVGPTFGAQIAHNAALAVLLSLILISAYMAFRFEAKYAIPVIIALFHDILITAGIYSIADREVTSGTVAAFLTILGYSLYDTVIVFDRIRENVPKLPRATFSQIANRSLAEVLTRSLITGASTVFLIAVILVFGGATLRDFAFAMMVGVLSGTYSSIFIGTPVLIAWKEREHSYEVRRYRIAETMGYVPAFPEDNQVARVDEASSNGARASTAIDDRAEPPRPAQFVAPRPAPTSSVDDERDAAERAARREEKKRRRAQRQLRGKTHGRRGKKQRGGG